MIDLIHGHLNRLTDLLLRALRHHDYGLAAEIVLILQAVQPEGHHHLLPAPLIPAAVEVARSTAHFEPDSQRFLQRCIVDAAPAQQSVTGREGFEESARHRLAILTLAYYHIQHERGQAALDYLDGWVTARPYSEDWEFHAITGWLLVQQWEQTNPRQTILKERLLKRALEHLDACISAQPSDWLIYYRFAQFLMARLESFDGAREVLEMGLFRNPHNLYLMENLLILLTQHFPSDLTTIEMLLANINSYCDTYVIVPKGPGLEAAITAAMRLLQAERGGDNN